MCVIKTMNQPLIFWKNKSRQVSGQLRLDVLMDFSLEHLGKTEFRFHKGLVVCVFG